MKLGNWDGREKEVVKMKDARLETCSSGLKEIRCRCSLVSLFYMCSESFSSSTFHFGLLMTIVIYILLQFIFYNIIY